MGEHLYDMGKCRVCFRFTQVDVLRLCKRCSNPYDKNSWKLGLSRDAIRRINRAGVYLIHAVGIKKYKIGKTNNLYKRVHSINHQYPIEMRVLKFWTVEDPRELESGLHHMFITYKLGQTDWFNFPERIAYRLSKFPSDKLVKLINSGGKIE